MEISMILVRENSIMVSASNFLSCSDNAKCIRKLNM